MEAVAAGPEAVADGGVDGAHEPVGDMRPPVTESTERRGAGDSVRAEAGPALVAPQRGVRMRAEVSVEGPGREAVPGQLELERGDVPAPVAVVDHAVAEAVPRVASERPLRLRAGDPVDCDSRPALERAYGTPGPGAHDAVDRASVKPARLQPDLEGGDVGGSAGTRIGGEREQPDEREQRNACSESHEQPSFAPWGRSPRRRSGGRRACP